MPATFNEFQRELNKIDMDPKIRYIFTLLYERFGQVLNDLEQVAKMQLAQAESMQGIVNLHEVTQKRVQQLAHGQAMDGVKVKSVANEPEKH